MSRFSITAIMGLDDRAYDKGLKRAERNAERSALQIQRSFGRHGAATFTDLSRRTRGLAKDVKSIGAITKASFAATVVQGSVAVFKKAISEAAKESRELSMELARAEKAGSKAWASLGRDLAPFVRGMDIAIARAGKLRDEFHTSVALLGAQAFGGVDARNNVVDAQRAERNDLAAQRRFAQDQNARRLGLEFEAAGSGPDAERARLRLGRERFNRDLAARVASGEITADQAAGLRNRNRERVDEKLAGVGRRDTSGDRDAELAAKLAGLASAIQTLEPGSAERRTLEQRRLTLQQIRAERAIDPNAPAAVQAAQREAALQAARAGIAGLRAQDRQRAEQRAAAVGSVEATLAQGRDRADLDDARSLRERAGAAASEREAAALRRKAKALERAVEARRIEARYAETVRSIDAIAGIDAEKRARLIAEAGSLRDRDLARLDEPGRSPVSARVAAAGTAADLRLQLLGGAGAGDPAARELPEQTRLLRRIADNSETPTPAVLG